MIIRPYEAAGHDQGVAPLTKPALRHSQSLRYVTHKACVALLTKPALSVSHWGRCFPRGGDMDFLRRTHVYEASVDTLPAFFHRTHVTNEVPEMADLDRNSDTPTT